MIYPLSDTPWTVSDHELSDWYGGDGYAEPAFGRQCAEDRCPFAVTNKRDVDRCPIHSERHT
ncbi:MAG: hypothetical protein ACREXT_05040 [Gammaproteobacteria bacterium]